MPKQDTPTFTPESRQAWRQWLKKHHRTEQSVWLTMYKKETGKPSMEWSDAVDEALCFGWIDSTRKSIGDGAFIQFFTRRKPGSNWSKINKDKVERLIAEGLMMKAGLDAIEIAKQNGSWSRLDQVEEGIIPKDLEKAFKAHPGSKKYFMGLSKSVRKMMLGWIAMAKRPETREKRILEIVVAAGEGRKPKQF
ncbi:YdeI/OmpD-associated family protein [Chitinophaga lutea]